MRKRKEVLASGAWLAVTELVGPTCQRGPGERGGAGLATQPACASAGREARVLTGPGIRGEGSAAAAGHWAREESGPREKKGSRAGPEGGIGSWAFGPNREKEGRGFVSSFFPFSFNQKPISNPF